MATPQEREAFLRGWHAAMEEALAVLATEASEWREDLENLRATLHFVVLIHSHYAPLQFVKLGQRFDRAELIDVERG